MLPRIKYRNPTIPMQINRHTDPASPSVLHIFTTPASSQPSSSPETSAPSAPEASSTPTFTIDIRDKEESEILRLLVEKIGATELQPTEQELQEMAELKEQKERSDKDRQEVLEKLIKVRREAELLRLARGEVPSVN
jgi:large subunit ribosomal protein MRP49